MKILVQRSYNGPCGSVRSWEVTVDKLSDAFKYCYEYQKQTWDESKINSWTNGYSCTEGYFGNQCLVTFKELK